MKVLLVNIFGGITRCDEVAEGLLTALDRLGATLPIVVRLDGTNEEEGRRDHAERAPDNVVVETDHALGRATSGRALAEGGGMSILVDASTRSSWCRASPAARARSTPRATRPTAPRWSPASRRARRGQDVDGIPVFNTVEDAVEDTGANTAMVFVPPRFAADAIYEALDSRRRPDRLHHRGHPGARHAARLRPPEARRPGRWWAPTARASSAPASATVGIMPTQVFTARSAWAWSAAAAR